MKVKMVPWVFLFVRFSSIDLSSTSYSASMRFTRNYNVYHSFCLNVKAMPIRKSSPRITRFFFFFFFEENTKLKKEEYYALLPSCNRNETF